MFQRASEIKTHGFVKLALYGDSGTGKTWAACSAPDVAFLCLESQAVLAIKAANPNAQVIVIDSWGKLRSTMDTLCRMQVLPFKTLVLDSATEACDLAAYHIVKSGNLAVQQWGDVHRMLDALFSDIRDLPCHTVVLALQHEDQVAVEGGKKDEKRIVYSPAVQPRGVRENFGSKYNIFGRTHVVREGSRVVYEIEFAPSQSTLCKGAPGVGHVEHPNLTDIFARVLGSRQDDGWEEFAEARERGLGKIADPAQRAFVESLTAAKFGKVPIEKRTAILAALTAETVPYSVGIDHGIPGGDRSVEQVVATHATIKE